MNEEERDELDEARARLYDRAVTKGWGPCTFNVNDVKIILKALNELLGKLDE